MEVEVAVMEDMVAGMMEVMADMVVVGVDTMGVPREAEEVHLGVQDSLTTVHSGLSTTAAWA